MRRRLQITPFVTLVLIWVMLQGEVTWANVIAGLLLAFFILMEFPLPPLSLGIRVHPWHFVVLVVRFNWDLVVASVQVAARAMQFGWQPQGHILRVPLRCDNDLIAVVNAEMNALVPGSVVIDVSPADKWMLLHVFHVPDDRTLHEALEKAKQQEIRVIRALSVQRDVLLADLDGKDDARRVPAGHVVGQSEEKA